MVPSFKGVAYAILYMRVVYQVYFMVVMSWAIFYLFAGFSGSLPWDACTEEWNTADCYSLDFDGECAEDEVFWNFTCSARGEYCQAHGYDDWDSQTDECVASSSSSSSSSSGEAFDSVLSESGISPAEDYFNGKVLGLTKNAEGDRYTWDEFHQKKTNF